MDDSVIEVDLRGDVILKVGGGSGTSTKDNHINEFRVSSKVLSTTSTAFEALLEPKFKEGLERDVSVQLSLPEDNPSVMLIILSVLHSQPGGVPVKLFAGTINDVAVLCDKYACRGALKLAAHLWVKNCQPQDMKQRFLLLESACMFRDGDLVNEAGREIVLNATEAINQPEYVVRFARILEDVFDKLEVVRLGIHMRISTFLKTQTEEIAKNHKPCPAPDCPRAGRECAAFASQLVSNGFTKDPTQLPLKTLLDQLYSIRLNKPPPANSNQTFNCRQYGYCSVFEEAQYKNEAMQLRSLVDGLCLKAARGTDA